MAMTVRLAAAVWLLALFLARPYASTQHGVAPAGHVQDMFQTAGECVACHNGLTSESGEDISIGTAWRASMMANASRDPYWHAAVRRETIDHPSAAEEIEHECSTCHMPMTSAAARASGQHARVFAHLGGTGAPEDRFALDGVSCTLCHQISAEGLGTPASFVGGFVIGAAPDAGERRMLGPFDIPAARASIMRSATGVTPAEASHLRQSELCATCHTLFTAALAPDGTATGRLPEQVPYLEWLHSGFRGEQSCQSCHMPEVAGKARIASVLGESRNGLGRHTFLGGNFFMLRMFTRHRAELGVEALPQELEATTRATLQQLATDTATVDVSGATVGGDRLRFDVDVRNLTGHKLPTGYPSRRAWLHVTVSDAGRRALFESGPMASDGRIVGNANDDSATSFEPHYDVITRPDQVQIYEAIMADAAGTVTTGLLRATRFVKDNRLLPRGFDKRSAGEDVAVHGGAAADDDFGEGGDRVSYDVSVAGASGPFIVDVEVRFQPIAFRWADNLRRYEAREPARFVSMFSAMASVSSAPLARATRRIP
jgi:hypothetical protein